MNDSINIVHFQAVGLKSVSLLTSGWLRQNVPFNLSRITASSLSHPQRSKRGGQIYCVQMPSSVFCWLSTPAVFFFLWLNYNHEGCPMPLSPANDIWQWIEDLLRLFMIARPILTFTGDPHRPNHQHPTAPRVSAALLQAWAFAASAHFRLQSPFQSSSRHDGLFHLLLFTQLFNHSAPFRSAVSSLTCFKMNHWFKLYDWALRHE